MSDWLIDRQISSPRVSKVNKNKSRWNQPKNYSFEYNIHLVKISLKR